MPYNMKIEFRQLSIDCGMDEYLMLQGIGSDEYGFTNEVNGMSFDEYKQWLIQQDDYSKARNLPEHFIPQTTYFLYVNARPVGLARIGHDSSDELEKRGVGNFGYGIAKPYRGKGYGNALFAHVKAACKELGYAKIKSFVHIENAASNRVLLKNGAKQIGIYNGEKIIYETIIE